MAFLLLRLLSAMGRRARSESCRVGIGALPKRMPLASLPIAVSTITATSTGITVAVRVNE